MPYIIRCKGSFAMLGRAVHVGLEVWVKTVPSPLLISFRRLFWISVTTEKSSSLSDIFTIRYSMNPLLHVFPLKLSHVKTESHYFNDIIETIYWKIKRQRCIPHPKLIFKLSGHMSCHTIWHIFVTAKLYSTEEEAIQLFSHREEETHLLRNLLPFRTTTVHFLYRCFVFQAGSYASSSFKNPALHAFTYITSYVIFRNISKYRAIGSSKLWFATQVLAL